MDSIYSENYALLALRGKTPLLARTRGSDVPGYPGKYLLARIQMLSARSIPRLSIPPAALILVYWLLASAALVISLITSIKGISISISGLYYPFPWLLGIAVRTSGWTQCHPAALRFLSYHANLPIVISLAEAKFERFVVMKPPNQYTGISIPLAKKKNVILSCAECRRCGIPSILHLKSHLTVILQ
jgi:hypothetical protein